MFRNYKGYYSVNSDDANSVLQVVNSLQISEIRPLSLMTVLKFICTIYQERRKTGSNSQAPLHIFCYDFFISQYGLKKLAEDKLRKVNDKIDWTHNNNLDFKILRFLALVYFIMRKIIESMFSVDW